MHIKFVEKPRLEIILYWQTQFMHSCLLCLYAKLALQFGHYAHIRGGKGRF